MKQVLPSAGIKSSDRVSQAAKRNRLPRLL